MSDSAVRLISTAEAARILGVSTVTALSYAHRGLLQLHPARRGFSFEETAVQALREELLEQTARWINLNDAVAISGLTEYRIKRGVAAGHITSRSAPRNQPTIDRATLLQYAAQLALTPPPPPRPSPPKPPEAPGPWLSSDDAAAALGVTRQWVAELARGGRLPGTRRGRFWWFRPADIASQR